jgi:hypothetical protein
MKSNCVISVSLCYEAFKYSKAAMEADDGFVRFCPKSKSFKSSTTTWMSISVPQASKAQNELKELTCSFGFAQNPLSSGSMSVSLSLNTL